MERHTAKDTMAQQTDFCHLFEPAERVRTAGKRKATSHGAAKTPGKLGSGSIPWPIRCPHAHQHSAGN